MSETNQPYKILGRQLRRLREGLHQSLAEVSGAIELEPEMLAKMEQGLERPTEDILVLLLNHFNLPEEQAEKLWQLAGYEDDKTAKIDELSALKPLVMLVQPDTRVIYSDQVKVMVNDSGVVLNFLQDQTGQGQRSVVARVGMSRLQANNVVKILQETLQLTQRPPLALPQPPKPSTKQDNIWLKRKPQQP